MKKLSLILGNGFLYTLLVAVSPLAAANGDNLLKDPGFEQNLTSQQGGWTLFDQSSVSSRQARGGSQSMFNFGFSRNQPTPPYLLGGASGSFQEFTAAPGSRWRLTGYGFAADPIKGTPAFGIVQISFFDADGNDLGTVETAGNKNPLAKTSNQVNRKTPVAEWIFLDTGIATAPAGAASVQAFTLFVEYSGAERTQGVYFDDLNLCAVAADDIDGSNCS